MIATIPVPGLTMQRDGAGAVTDVVPSGEGDFVSVLAEIALEHAPLSSTGDGTVPIHAASVEVAPPPLPQGFSLPTQEALTDLSSVIPVALPLPAATMVPDVPTAPALPPAPVPAAAPGPNGMAAAGQSVLPVAKTVPMPASSGSTIAAGPIPGPAVKDRLPETASPSAKSAPSPNDAPPERLSQPILASGSAPHSVTAKQEAASLPVVSKDGDAQPPVRADNMENVSNMAESAARGRIADPQIALVRTQTDTAGVHGRTNRTDTAADPTPQLPIDRRPRMDTPPAPVPVALIATARPVADALSIPQLPEAEGTVAHRSNLPSRTPATDMAVPHIPGHSSDAARDPKHNAVPPEQRVTPLFAPIQTPATVADALPAADQPLPSAALPPAVQPAATQGAFPTPAPTAAPPTAPPPHLVPDIVALAASGADGPITLQLRPEELGLLHFHVTRTAEGTHLHLTVEQPATLDLLRRHADDLLADLQRAGFGGASLSYAGSDAGEGARDGPAPAQDDPSDVPPPPFVTVPLRPAAPGSLDLRL